MLPWFRYPEPLASGAYTLRQLGSSVLSVVQGLDPFSLKSTTRQTSSVLPDELDAAGMNGFRGLLAVLAASLISGFTCVYFEKIMKDSLTSVSVWVRNAQLAFFSIFPALFIGVLLQDGAEVAEHGFFAGYSPLVWLTVFLQAIGGIIVAVCIAYADNVAKNFAASLQHRRKLCAWCPVPGTHLSIRMSSRWANCVCVCSRQLIKQQSTLVPRLSSLRYTCTRHPSAPSTTASFLRCKLGNRHGPDT